ncbi:MAG: hypothetical protein IPL61_35315 [Myxococcales bacterium]|nr:hypothetical protein [Myxococcales bacterium]
MRASRGGGAVGMLAGMSLPTAVDLSQIVPTPRRSTCQYRDPLDEVWVRAAEQMGLRVVRADGAYADYDGRGTLAIGTAQILDPDDCVAQIVFHEVCHWLVEGRDSMHQLNWGLANDSLADLRRENASLRVQAALATPHGLRRFLANTTDHRAYYDALPDDPLAQDDDDTVGLARTALARAAAPPWGAPLAQALAATAAIVAAVWPTAIQPSLYATFDAA